MRLLGCVLCRKARGRSDASSPVHPAACGAVPSWPEVRRLWLSGRALGGPVGCRSEARAWVGDARWMSLHTAYTTKRCAADRVPRARPECRELRACDLPCAEPNSSSDTNGTPADWVEHRAESAEHTRLPSGPRSARLCRSSLPWSCPRGCPQLAASLERLAEPAGTISAGMMQRYVLGTSSHIARERAGR